MTPEPTTPPANTSSGNDGRCDKSFSTPGGCGADPYKSPVTLISQAMGNLSLRTPKNNNKRVQEAIENNNNNKEQVNKGRRVPIMFLSGAYLYLPILLFAAAVQYYGGVNEAVIAVMSQTYHHYGTLHGEGDVYAQTEYGALKGFKTKSREGREYYEFLGIPYATPPIGNLRFQAPIPPKPWEGVRDATGYSPPCVQYDLFLQSTMGQEDCLTLNVYTPKVRNMSKEGGDGEPLPVLLFIHGGMYHFGRSMDFRGTYFMDLDPQEEVVLVTINYRLQALGFLNTGDGVVRGNMGLKDQVMAMKWIKRNIQNFGGDPNLVTIWGESAGGASTHLHALSPMSKGLFHRAISNSGFPLAHWSFVRKPSEQSKLFAQAMGCPTNSSTRVMVDCLRTISVTRLAEHFRGNHDVLHPRLDVFAPTIESGEPHENDTETFLAAHPRELLREGKVLSKVPMINGANSMEGLIYAGYFVRNETVAEALATDWSKHAPVLLDFEDLPAPLRDQTSRRIWNHYIGYGKKVDMSTLYPIVDLFSDTSFFKPMEETALLLASKVPMYLYVYNHHGEFGVAQGYFRLSMMLPMTLDGIVVTGASAVKRKVLGIPEKHYGPCHADELAIFFGMHPLLSWIPKGHPEFKFSKEMVRTWAYFAKHGKPSPFQGHDWTQLTPGEPLKYMKLDSAPSPGMIQAPWTKRLKYLNSLPGFQCIPEYSEKGESNNNEPICF